MQVVIQRVQRAAVTVEGEVSGQIGPGLLALVGVGRHSTDADAVWLASKTVALRVFGDAAGRMNRSVADVGGAVLAVSQFTCTGTSLEAAAPRSSAPPILRRASACTRRTARPSRFRWPRACSARTC